MYGMKRTGGSDGASVSDLLASHKRATKRRRKRRAGGGSAAAERPETVEQCIRSHLASLRGKATSAQKAASDQASDSPFVVCLLFIIIDSLPFEGIWRRWLGGTEANPNMAAKGSNAGRPVLTKVLVHAKFPEKVKSEWVRARLIKESYKPEWGSVEITKAMVALLKRGVEATSSMAVPTGDDRVRFLFASESCVPVCKLPDAATALSASKQSWLQVKYKPRTGYNGSSQWLPIENSSLIPKECVCKADQWVCLTRTHAKEIFGLAQQLDQSTKVPRLPASIDAFWPAFKKGCASDEMYFPTMLSCCGILPTRVDGSAGPSDGVAPRQLTYVRWIHPDLDDYSRENSMVDRPVAFEMLDPGLFATAREKGCLFLRKLIVPKKKGTVSITAEAWEKCV